MVMLTTTRMDVIAESALTGYDSYELNLQNFVRLQRPALYFDAEAAEAVRWLCKILPELPQSVQLDDLTIGFWDSALEVSLTDKENINWSELDEVLSDSRFRCSVRMNLDLRMSDWEAKGDDWLENCVPILAGSGRLTVANIDNGDILLAAGESTFRSSP
jgi:hypothetical protein